MKNKEIIINQDPFDRAMARWERRFNIIAWGILAFAVAYFAPVVIEIILR